MPTCHDILRAVITLICLLLTVAWSVNCNGWGNRVHSERQRSQSTPPHLQGVNESKGVLVHRTIATPCGDVLDNRRGDSLAGAQVNYAFTGHEKDDTLGMHDMGARFYSPALCRFTSRDPIEHAGSPYVYASNNFINHIDPDGMADEKTKEPAKKKEKEKNNKGKEKTAGSEVSGNQEVHKSARFEIGAGSIGIIGDMVNRPIKTKETRNYFQNVQQYGLTPATFESFLTKIYAVGNKKTNSILTAMAQNNTLVVLHTDPLDAKDLKTNTYLEPTDYHNVFSSTIDSGYGIVANKQGFPAELHLFLGQSGGGADLNKTFDIFAHALAGANSYITESLCRGCGNFSSSYQQFVARQIIDEMNPINRERMVIPQNTFMSRDTSLFPQGGLYPFQNVVDNPADTTRFYARGQRPK